VEIWLDSIDTGHKIGICNISGTGSWTTFGKFCAPVENVAGRHDVYLKFTGTGTDKLFQLKSMCFISKDSIQSGIPSFVRIVNYKPVHMIKVYPNPFNNHFSVSSDLEFNELSIVDIEGKMVYKRKFSECLTSTTLDVNISKGTYLLRLYNSQILGCSKIIIQ
jgi:hypothetical protein